MDGPGDYHTKVTKVRKKMNVWFHLYVESKKKNTNELICETETDSQT